MTDHGFDAARTGQQAVEPLLSSAREGNAEALGDLAERCRRYLLQVARRELNAELRVKVAPSDLVQQTLLEVQRNLDGFEGTTAGEFQAWARQILLNQARGAARRFQGASKRNIRREVPLDAVEMGAGPAALVDDIQSPSKQAVANERMQALAAAIVRLPAQYQQVIELRNIELCSFAEIGESMSRSAKAARSLWIRAIDALRDEME